VTAHELYAGNALENDLTLAGDVAIIGSGAGGGVTAEILARAGLRVVLVEEGAHWTARDFTLREVASFARFYHEGGVRSTRDRAIGVLQGRTVGGSTTVNWTSTLRTPPRTLRHWVEAWGLEGLGPEAMTPWFALMERRLHVAPWTDHNTNNALLARGAAALGWHHDPLPRNVRGCVGLGYCGLGCPIGAKQSMLVTTIPAALDRGAALVSRVRAERLERRGDRVVAVAGLALDARGVRPTGRRVRVEAPFFVLAGGAINGPALLLRSQVPDPYRTLGTRTFLQIHNYSIAATAAPVDGHRGAPQSVHSEQFLWRDGVSGRAGYHLEAVGAQPVGMMNFRTAFGRRLAEQARAFRHVHILVAQIRDGFHADSPGGTVTLGADGTPVLDYPLTSHLWEAVRSSYLTMAECQFAAGAATVTPATMAADPYRSWAEARTAIAGLRLRSPDTHLNSTHPLGGCAMGKDPRRTVVNGEGRHHQLANLAVIDGSVFPTSVGVNPGLSIYALAARQATRLAERLGRTVPPEYRVGAAAPNTPEGTASQQQAQQQPPPPQEQEHEKIESMARAPVFP